MLTGKVAVITGGARGNGEGIARVFASEGATVCLWDVLDTAARTAERIAAEYGRPARAWQVDISDAAAVEAAAADVIRAFGTVDILVNNAAVAPEVPFVEMEPALRERVWRVNVDGAMNCTQAVLPEMIRRGRGKIIVVSSITGPLTAIPGLTMYASTKGALLGFTRNLALEMAPHGINVNCILPGTIDTPLLRWSLSGAGHATDGQAMVGERPPADDDAVAAFGAAVPWGRVGTMAEVGGVAAFLASEWSDYVTGTEIVVDGGSRLTEWGLAAPGSPGGVTS
ncbi:MAG: SDR family NAD(P)-dependent oxidoreductase [Thermoleophilia bacterium]